MGRITEETKNKESLIVYKSFTGEKIKLNKSIVETHLLNGQTVTQSEMSYFLALCKARGLNPFTKEVYLIKYGSQPAQIVVSKDFLEKRAIKNKFYEGKKFGITVINSRKEIERRNGSIYDKDTEKLLGAWCEVYRSDWKYPAISEVNLSEYIQTKKDGEANIMWANKPVTMITKVAKAQALREAFIEELSGLYESEEVGVDLNKIQEPEIIEEVKVVQDEPVQETEDVNIDDIF